MHRKYPQATAQLDAAVLVAFLRRRSATAASSLHETGNAFAGGPALGGTGRVKLDDYLVSFQQVVDHPRQWAAQDSLAEPIRQLRQHGHG